MDLHRPPQSRGLPLWDNVYYGPYADPGILSARFALLASLRDLVLGIPSIGIATLVGIGR